MARDFHPVGLDTHLRQALCFDLWCSTAEPSIAAAYLVDVEVGL